MSQIMTIRRINTSTKESGALHHSDGTNNSAVVDDVFVRRIPNLSATTASNSSNEIVSNGADNRSSHVDNSSLAMNSSDGNFTLLPPLLEGNGTLLSNTTAVFTSDAGTSGGPGNSTSSIIFTVVPLVMFLSMCLAGRRRAPPRELWRGAEIRARAQRIYQQRELRMARKRVAPEDRERDVASNMHRMQIVSRDVATGQWKLGRETTVDCSTEATTSNPSETPLDSSITLPDGERDLEEGLTTPVSPQDTVSLSEESRQEQLDQKMEEKTAVHEPMVCSEYQVDQCKHAKDITVDDDDDVCYICLDTFKVGDTVMWSRQRHGPCSHVFHEECLMPWLLEKRENECPSCRACFIQDRSFRPESVGSGGDSSNDNNHDDDANQMVKTIESMDYSNGYPSSLKDDQDVDEGFTFVISKGLIGRVPNQDFDLSIPVSFLPVCSDEGKVPENRHPIQNKVTDTIDDTALRRRAASERLSRHALGGDTVANTPSSSWDEDDADERSHGSPRNDMLREQLRMLSFGTSPDIPSNVGNTSEDASLEASQSEHDLESAGNVDVNEHR
jgi:hypothetical protein